MWGAASLITDGLCSDDGFWYFQPWLIGQGQHWYQLAAHNPDNLADIPAVRALAADGPAGGPTRSGRNGKSLTTSPAAPTATSPGRKTASMTR
jgi:hypothetical protein